MRVVNFARAVGLFAYKFVVGDDLIVASVMVGALLVTAALVAGHVNAWWLVPPVAVAMTGLNLWRRRARAG